MAARLEEACTSAGARGGCVQSGDPALDQFMEAYCEMLIKYEQELSKSLTEATLFFATVQRHFQAFTFCFSDSSAHTTTTNRDRSQKKDRTLGFEKETEEVA
ncbi:hypothetical protein SASPL_121409 [Salvia splendens]|uniref:KNOX2 domain-containing protein n=1 Tax=Salvia splendens TaxID=180675 RepID=A0A8X8XW10_SALSN|nr:hypothetical protein SASPL_121409 [Salvia splendens]